jgi:ABC-type amino acid transport substrate-binding protein
MFMHLSLLLALYYPLHSQASGNDTVLRCAIAEGYAPYQFSDTDQHAQGFDADITRLIGERSGLHIELQVMAWRQAYFQLASGRIDCIAGMEITENRQDTFLFSIPYYSRYSSIFVLERRHDLNSPTDLSGQRVCTDPQSQAENQLRESGLTDKLTLLRPASKTIAAQMLIDNQTDAMIAPRAVGYFLAQQFQQSFKTIYIDPQGLPVAIALNPSRQDLLEPINRALSELQNDAAFLQLKQRWQLQNQEITSSINGHP